MLTMDLLEAIIFGFLRGGLIRGSRFSLIILSILNMFFTQRRVTFVFLCCHSSVFVMAFVCSPKEQSMK